jgi:YD repeat-containing protein
MELLLSPGSITYDGWWGQAMIDLAFGTSWAQERKVFCGVREDLDHQSDHLPVATTVMIEVETREPPERLQWQRTDHGILTREFEKNLPPLTAISSKNELDKRVEGIINAITKAIEASTPKAKPSPRSIHGWTEECKAAQMTARRLRRRFQRTRLEADWEAYRQARNYKGRLIKKTLRDAHRSRVREAADTQDGL